MQLSRLAVKRPITTAMLLISVLVLGGIAIVRLPLAYLPEIDVPFIGVQIPFPNSNPKEIEREIVKPVEEVLSTLTGVKTLNATASADQAEFFLEFDWGHELDVVRMQVSEKMDQVKGDLPTGIGEVVIFSFNTSDIPVVQARVSAKGVNLSESYDLIEARILNRIRRVPGVARVSLEGVEPREIFVDLILDRVKQHNIDVGALIQQLQGASTNLVLGQIEDGGLRFSARALGEFTSVGELGELIINEQGLRVRDIAELSYEEPPYPYGRHLDGQFAVALEVYKESTANTVDVVRRVMSVIETEINDDPLLQGVNVFVWEDQGETQGTAQSRGSGCPVGHCQPLCLSPALRFDADCCPVDSVFDHRGLRCNVLHGSEPQRPIHDGPHAGGGDVSRQRGGRPRIDRPHPPPRA